MLSGAVVFLLGVFFSKLYLCEERAVRKEDTEEKDDYTSAIADAPDYTEYEEDWDFQTDLTWGKNSNERARQIGFKVK